MVSEQEQQVWLVGDGEPPRGVQGPCGAGHSHIQRRAAPRSQQHQPRTKVLPEALVDELQSAAGAAQGARCPQGVDDPQLVAGDAGPPLVLQVPGQALEGVTGFQSCTLGLHPPLVRTVRHLVPHPGTPMATITLTLTIGACSNATSYAIAADRTSTSTSSPTIRTNVLIQFIREVLEAAVAPVDGHLKRQGARPQHLPRQQGAQDFKPGHGARQSPARPTRAQAPLQGLRQAAHLPLEPLLHEAGVDAVASHGCTLGGAHPRQCVREEPEDEGVADEVVDARMG
jgi:hypothetical protein